MPRWNWKCDRCGFVSERMFPNAAIADVSDVRCMKCDARMTRQPSAPNFTIHGFRAANGYAHAND